MTDAAERDPMEVVTGIFEEWWGAESGNLVVDTLKEQCFAAFLVGYTAGIDKGIEFAHAAENERIADYYGIEEVRPHGERDF
jgi:hypothetical protein